MLQEIMQFISQHPILSLAWVLLFGAVVFTSFKNSLSKVKEVTRGEATRLINKEDAVVVDIRTREDYRKGHIANSINLIPSDIKMVIWVSWKSIKHSLLLWSVQWAQRPVPRQIC